MDPIIHTTHGYTHTHTLALLALFLVSQVYCYFWIVCIIFYQVKGFSKVLFVISCLQNTASSYAKKKCFSLPLVLYVRFI